MLCVPALAAEIAVDYTSEYRFTAADFSDSDGLEGVYISSVPPAYQAELCIGSRVICRGDILPAAALEKMKLRPVCLGNADCELVYCPIEDGTLGDAVTVSLRILSGTNTAPVCEDGTLETYKNIANTGTLSATDQEDQELTYQLVKEPKRGTVELHTDGSFTYTPDKNKVGKDSFVFTATDPAGNVSNEACVKIRILKPADKATYQDMSGDRDAFAAMWLKDKGLSFGLWFEPESVNPDSDLYRAHPDWALTDGFQPVLGRNQLLLDLTKPEVRDYIVENVSRILDSAGISYVQGDMNRHSVALGAKAHDFVLGMYDVLRRIFAPRPDILLESCSSGGNRFDLGMLCFSPQIWASDNTDPIERLTIQNGISYLYPQSTMGAHVSAAPHAQTLRNTPLNTRGNVAFFGCLGYELDLRTLLPVEIKEIQGQIAFYKRYREVFQFGTFRRTELGWQVSDGKVTLAGVFHRLVNAAPGYERLRVKGLKPETDYRVTSLAQAIRVGQFGNLLKHVAPVNVNPNGALLRIADRHITLPGKPETLTASGAALAAGIMLSPLFRGTGYAPEQRTQGDFGSDVYLIEEIGGE